MSYPKNIVVVSHSLEEAITKCIMTNLKAFDIKFAIVSLQELMSDYEIFDKVTDVGTNIRWIRESSQISNRDYYLLNRVLYVPNRLFTNFTKVDRDYALREFEAYIGFSFNAFNGIGNHLANGVCVESVGLPKQWQKIAEELEISVPNYYWGPRNYNYLSKENKVSAIVSAASSPVAAGIPTCSQAARCSMPASLPKAAEKMTATNNLVYSNIYNFLNWSLSSKQHDENHIFCFEKPVGKPVFILTIGDKHLITTDIILTNELSDKLKFLAKRVNQFFKHFISEILIFINDDKLIFGCINPEIIRSTKNKAFENFVCTNLICEFYKCIP